MNIEDVKQINDVELNLSIAKVGFDARVCGNEHNSNKVIIGTFGAKSTDTRPLTGNWKTAVWSESEESAWEKIPDYSNDIHFAREAQAKAISATSPERYIDNLFAVVISDSYILLDYMEIAQLLTATPRQIAVASYITLMEEQDASQKEEKTISLKSKT